ncbi:MAG: hypothetical protein IJL63_07945 [Clostridia bacterium]|nr:hypothetical protein [Clostridia bacterium]
MKKDEYIASAVSKISNQIAKRETEKELAAHIDELTEFYLDRSSSKEEAEERAVADMGGSELIAEKLSQLHPSPISTFLLVLTVIGLIRLLIAIVFYFEFFLGGIMDVLKEIYVTYELMTDGFTFFCAKPIIVLILSIINVTAREKDDCPSPYNGLLAIICVGIWVIAAYASFQTVSLGF